MVEVLVSRFSGSYDIITIGEEAHLDELVDKLEREAKDAIYFLALGYSEEIEERLRRVRGSLSSYTQLLLDEMLYDMNRDRQLFYR